MNPTTLTMARDRATGELVHLEDGSWYRIDHLESMEPFLLTVVSDSDLWMFVSSAGPLTAGRIDADRAVLPYETDDRLHRAVDVTGPVTLIVRDPGGERELWQPFARHPAPGVHRRLRKHVLGNALVLEEEHPGWGLAFEVRWEPSRRFGWVRTSRLVDRQGVKGVYEVLDGLLDVMPAGVDAATEQTTSNLVDAYKRSETGRWGTVAVYTLETLISDRAEPSESLAATVVWSAGLDGAALHLDERIIDDVRAARARPTTGLLTGRRGAYLRHARVDLGASSEASWLLAIDTGLGQAAVRDLLPLTRDPDVRARVAEDVRAGSERLATLLAGADGVQRTGDPVADAHHLSNVLFNSMRGGVFPHGYRIPVEDLLDFLSHRNVEVHRRHAAALTGRAPWMELEALHAAVAAWGDPELLRLVLEYLPLTFSRRHGDPSRPWNRFSIRVTTDDGAELLNYEGNWRDIFQNWEALLRSYPAYLPHVVAKFLSATTTDGHNPYRISREGIDWEEPRPEDPWGNIGYWGDHQIVYLHRLLRGWQATDPDGPRRWLDRRLFSYADVPYRLADHAAMVRDPRDTIAFDTEVAARVAERVARTGADGRLVHDAAGVVTVTLTEKLLVPALAKLCSYVAGGGIWMNTQRPEWNDANNALAGYGLSMVTLYHLHHYLTDVRDLLGTEDGPVSLSRSVHTWLAAVGEALSGHDPSAAVDGEVARRRLLDDLGHAGAAHRERTRAGFDAGEVSVDRAEVVGFLEVALGHLAATVAAARRSDGLFHAYNLLAFPSPDRAVVTHLAPMLEGQVAVIGSRALTPADAVEVVDALFDSALYRADQASFLLYPATPRPAFLDRNTLPDRALERYPGLAGLVGQGGSAVLHADADGGVHFRPGLTNGRELAAALDARGVGGTLAAQALEVYEELFDHHAFTGRSGGMYGYEGIGSIYWHMVSKLLLAVQERYLEALGAAGDSGAGDAGAGTAAAGEDTTRRLAAAYLRIRDGLGFRKDPVSFGAVPTDCYSHTPAHAGAQQPGMTGQVKEEVIARLGELGLIIADGRLTLTRPLLPPEELWDLTADVGPSYSATVCEVPVVVRPGPRDLVRLRHADGRTEEHPGSSVPQEACAALFGRTGTVLEVAFETALVPVRR